MNHADLISSGMTFFAESMLWLWTAILLTIGYIVLRPSLSKTAPSAATITSTRVHGSEEFTSARSYVRSFPI